MRLDDEADVRIISGMSVIGWKVGEIVQVKRSAMESRVVRIAEGTSDSSGIKQNFDVDGVGARYDININVGCSSSLKFKTYLKELLRRARMLPQTSYL